MKADEDAHLTVRIRLAGSHQTCWDRAGPVGQRLKNSAALLDSMHFEVWLTFKQHLEKAALRFLSPLALAEAQPQQLFDQGAHAKD